MFFDLNASQRGAGSHQKSEAAKHVAKYNANSKFSRFQFVEFARGNKYVFFNKIYS